MNSTTNPTSILENANYIFGRFFDGWENVYLGEQRERTGTLYVKSHRIGTLNQFRVDKEYSDADIRTDIYRAISKYLNEFEDAENKMTFGEYGWEDDVINILCDDDYEFNYQFNEELLTEEEKKKIYG